MSQFKGRADFLVIAGDILTLKFIDQVRDRIAPFCERYEHIIYVPGNHEFYDTSVESALLVLGAVQSEFYNFHVLKNTDQSIDGKHFYGGTMWFPELPGNEPLKKQISDFHLIRGFQPWVYEQNAEFMEGYDRCVDGDTVVISHHLPSYLSVPPRWKSAPGEATLNRFFVNEMDARIKDKGPRLWLHGHTHKPCDYSIERTRVLCNPLGYPQNVSLEVSEYNPNLIVEI